MVCREPQHLSPKKKQPSVVPQAHMLETRQDILLFMGHEWRNQLSLMNLTIKKLAHELNNTLEQSQQQMLQRLQQSAAAMQRVARNYLNIMLVEERSCGPQPILVDLVQDVIEVVRFSYADMLNQSQQKMHVLIAQRDRKVWGDPTLLMCVYDNLIGNAIQHGEQGGKIVLCVVEKEAMHEICVWNSGPGIANDRLETIFERFNNRVAETKSSDGLGLGLYLTRKIVEAHGGQVWADSLPGGWANFTFTLPKQNTPGALKAKNQPLCVSPSDPDVASPDRGQGGKQHD